MLSVVFVFALLSTPPEFDRVAQRFVDAIERRDAGALTPGSLYTGPGTAPELLDYHTNIIIDSFRITSVETKDDKTLLHMELDGTSEVMGTHRRVQFPPHWVVEIRPDANAWKVVRAAILERVLSIQSLRATDEERDRLLQQHPDIDVDRYLLQLANDASNIEPEAACGPLMWVLRQSQARGSVGGEVTALTLISSLYYGNSAQSLPPAEEAVARAEAAQQPEPLSDAYFTLGIALWLANRLPEAITALERSASYIGEVDDPRQQLQALYMAANVEARLDNIRRALALGEKHEELAELYPVRRGRYDSEIYLSDLHLKIGNVDVARAKMEIAHEEARKLRDPGSEALTLYNLATIDPSGTEVQLRRMYEALDLGQKSLGVDSIAAIRMNVARLQVTLGEFDGANATFATVLADAHQHDDRNVLATTYAARSELRALEGRYEDALNDALAARRFAEGEGATGRTNMGVPQMQALHAQATALYGLGRGDEAIALWRTAIDVAELELTERAADESSSATLMQERLAPYRRLLNLYVEEGCARDALAIAERMRARVLRDSLRHGRIDLSAGLDPARRDEEHALELALADINRRLLVTTDPESTSRVQQERNAARLALRTFRSEVYVTHPAIARRRAETSEVYDAWSPNIAENELVLEYTVTPDAILLFALQGSSIDAYRLPVTRKTLDEDVTAFTNAIESRNFRYRANARALYDVLFAPVLERVAHAKRIRIVADGPLWRVPFQALVGPDDKHLIEHAAVAYAPSLALSQRAATERAPRAFFALADPAIATMTARRTRSLFRDATLGRLPEAAKEARAIARLYKDSEVQTGTAATESTFKRDAAEFRILHLAAHSIVDDGAPMFSSIVLASSGSDALEDGLLEAREIADLKLRADLAVLSACDTAGGKITPGEGVVGLSWAFLAAGVPTTVVSQWKVNSSSTADLMVAFHQRLREGASASDALRDAIVELRKDARWRHPFYWAPFVVMENVGGR